MKAFTQKEKALLKALVKSASKSGKPLCSAFSECAKKTGRASGSVRNYYYRSVAKSGGLPPVKTAVKFTKEQEIELIRAVLSARLKHGSTRKAIYYLAGGNQTLARRYQNKFAALLKNSRALIMRETLIQKQREGVCFNPYRTRAVREKAIKAGRKLVAF